MHHRMQVKWNSTERSFKACLSPHNLKNLSPCRPAVPRQGYELPGTSRMIHKPLPQANKVIRTRSPEFRSLPGTHLLPHNDFIRRSINLCSPNSLSQGTGRTVLPSDMQAFPRACLQQIIKQPGPSLVVDKHYRDVRPPCCAACMQRADRLPAGQDTYPIIT